ncbi:pimeloyl-ACP methyl ester carboxylesterase [Halorubrum alkaliphilum]|uniref:Pimeloyl-ACP methyl ester carboxylesterase n=1 Tax=Halorubrum alkaliphilum TaxID=261290 RepID=A0A8T4GGT9_9EURY|nr:alpha/beta hydrolase [Halorubrum alkaliphilum]MBP1922870.1 pimeloyl-ACP methyl ester carboxylesterase [Halorubrum alkaliphilum]
MPTETINGTQLYYEESGDGTPVVFLHGVLMGSRFFNEQQNSIAEDHRPVVLDFRGHGRSAKSETGHTLPTYAADLEAFLESQSFENIVLVGWSMGSLVAWEYIDHFGTDRLSGFVSVEQQPLDLEQEDYEHGVFDFDELIDLMELAQTDHHELGAVLIDQMFANEPPADIRQLVFDEIARVPPAIKSAIFFDQSVRDYRDVLSDVDIPTLVCVGEDDTLLDPAGVEYIAEQTPNATLERFTDSGHCPFLEEPDKFNRIITEFVDNCTE